MKGKLVALFTAGILVLGGAVMPGIASAKPKHHHSNNAGSCDPEDFIEYFECLFGFPN
jgi:hypothetical protein